MVDEGKTEAQLIEAARTTRKKSSPAIYFGFLPVLLSLALVIGLWLFPPSVVVYEPHYLLPVFNSSLFVAAFVIAYIALRSYLISGAATILWLGCGVLTLGAGALAAGWLIIPFGPNVNVTIFNVGVLLAAICHAGGVLSTLEEKPGEADPGNRRRKAALGYLAALTGIGLLVALTLAGIMPPFFIQGKGPTVLRQYVVEWALVLLIFASLVIMQRFLRKRASFLYWYSLALALVAISMLAFFLQPAVGSPIGWVGRSSYVLAAVYFLVSVNSALRNARTRGLGLSEALAEFFGPGLHWHGIMATVSDAVVSYDDKGEILLWNKAAERIFGYPETEVVGKGIDLILPDTKAIAPGSHGEITEIEPARQDGSRFNAEISVSTQKSSLGVITTLIVRDVTERKRAEDETQRLLDAIQQEKDKLTALVNSINDEVWFADSQMKFTLANPSALREFGLGAIAEIDVAKFAESLEVYRADGSLRPIEEAPPLRALQGELIRNLEEIIRTPASGELRYRQVSASAVKDVNGNIIGSVSVARDITQLKRAEEALRESEARFRGLFENMSEGMALHEIIYDDRHMAVDYRILATNPAFAAHTGLEPGQIQGQKASTTYGAGEAPFLETFARVAEGGQPVSFETFFQPLQRHFSISVTSPKPGQFVTIFQDITERKRTEREIQRLASFPQMNPLPVLEMDLDGRITYYNQAALKALGKEGQAEDLKKFLPDDLEEILAAAKQTGEGNFRREILVNGAVFFENIYFAEELKAIRLYAIDITERQRAEAALRESEEHYHSLFNNMLNGYAYCKMHFEEGRPTEFTYLEVNDAFGELTGLKNVAGKKVSEVIPGLRESDPQLFEIYGRVALTGTPERFETYAEALGMWFAISVYSPQPEYFVAIFDVITERKRAEAALRDSEERFRTMANAIPQLAWTAGADGYIFWYNQRWYDYTGTTPADMEGWGWQSVHDPEMLPQVLERWRASIVTGRPFDMVFPLRGADGQFRQFLTRVVPMKDADGKVMQWFGTNTDITERQEAEAALRRAKEEWERTFDAVPDLIAILDEHHRIVRVNLSMAKVLGAKPEDLVGRACYEVMHHSSGPLPICPHSKLLDDGREHTAELRELGRDFLVSASPLRDDGGQLIGSVHVARDITARKQAEAALHRLNEELEQRVEERTGELQETVAQLEEEIADRQQAEQQAASLGRLYRLLSRVYEVIVHAQDQEGLFRQACRIMMEEGDFLLCWIGRVDREAGLVRAAAQFDLMEDYPQNVTISLADVPEGRGPSGVAVREERWDVCLDIATDPRMAPWRSQALARGFRSSAAFPLFVGGRVEGVLTLYSGQKGFFNQEEVAVLNSLAQDLSFAMESMHREAKRRQAEDEIRRLNEALEQRVKKRTAELEFANRELEAFAYSVSHDLKAPLRAIQGFSRMLLGEHAASLDEEGLRLFNVIVSNTQIMSNLIDDLLALSRLGRLHIKKSVINMSAMTKKVFDQLQAQVPERDLRLTVGDLPAGLGDQSLVHQVILNLLANAIKFTKSKKPAIIEVGGMYGDNETIYYFKDNGIGFDPRYAGKLYGVFHRLHGGDEYEGTGVGLAIVKRIIERHGGRVWAEGKLNEGATFYFSLPKNGR